jgi:hypothetical protein
MYHSDLMTLSNAMNLVINKKYNGANKWQNICTIILLNV